MFDIPKDPFKLALKHAILYLFQLMFYNKLQ